MFFVTIRGLTNYCQSQGRESWVVIRGTALNTLLFSSDNGINNFIYVVKNLFIMYEYQFQARVVMEVPGFITNDTISTRWYQLGNCHFRNPVMLGNQIGLEQIITDKKKDRIAKGRTIYGIVEGITQVPIEFGAGHDTIRVDFYMPVKDDYKRVEKILNAASQRNRLTDVHSTAL